MLNKKDFAEIGKEIKKLEEQREVLIRKSRDILSLSKQLIYSLHRNELKEASVLADKANKEKKSLQKMGSFTDTNIDSAAFQEYAEAVTYYEFVKSKTIPSAKSLGISVEDYLLGLCDLTGELVRRAVASVIGKNFKEAEEIKSFVEELYGEFIKFDLRNGELRKKADSIRWNLKKLEEVIYDYKLKSR